MSKIRFDLKKLQVPASVRMAGRILQTVDTLLHPTTADLISVDLFARGKEQGFTLLLDDRQENIQLRVAFAQRYGSPQTVVYYAPAYNMGEFMREVTALINKQQSKAKVAFFGSDGLEEAAKFIVDYFDGAL